MFGNMNLPAFQYGPSDMLKDYKSISFQVGDERVNIAVNEYRNNDHKLFPDPKKNGTQDALIVKDGLLSLDYATILQRAGGPQAFVSVFVGKGSPASIATVLTLFYDYSEKFIAHFGKGVGPRRKCADWLADKHLSWQDTLQNISNEFIGLDCNGFVGNWLAAADGSLGLKPDTPPRYFRKPHKTLRAKVDDIQLGDVVTWASGVHVAAIDDVPDAGNQNFYICQSAGGGPRRNAYTIKVSSPGKFRLSGGYPAGDVGGEVLISSPWH
jgi:hypothetical protein